MPLRSTRSATLLLASTLTLLAREPLAAQIPAQLPAQAPSRSPAQGPAQGAAQVPSRLPAQVPSQSPATAPQPAALIRRKPVRPEAVRRYDVKADNQHVESFLLELAKRESVTISFLRLLDIRVTLEARNATFQEVLEKVCDNLDLAYHQTEDRTYVVGYPEDLEVSFNQDQATAPVEIVYRARHLTVESLAESLNLAFPTLKAYPGPTVKSPTPNGQASSGSSMPSGPSFGPSGPSGPSGPGMPMGPGGPSSSSTTSPNTMRRFDVIIVGPPEVARRALAFARKLDSGRQQVRINVKLMEMTDNTSQDLGIIWALPGEAGGPPEVSFTELPKASLGPNFSGNPQMKFGAFAHTAATANLTLEAAEALSKVKTLANPSLMVLDGERCSILIGDRLLYPKQTGTNSQGNPTFDVAELKTGIYLQMAPQIGLDHDVVLSVYPQDSSVTAYANYSGNSYPIITTREAQTTVRLRSGEMLVIGGLRVDTDTRTKAGVPLLSSIPVLGALFGGNGKKKSTSDLVLMIQPEILDSEGPGSSSIKPAASPD